MSMLQKEIALEQFHDEADIQYTVEATDSDGDVKQYITGYDYQQITEEIDYINEVPGLMYEATATVNEHPVDYKISANFPGDLLNDWHKLELAVLDTVRTMFEEYYEPDYDSIAKYESEA